MTFPGLILRAAGFERLKIAFQKICYRKTCSRRANAFAARHVYVGVAGEQCHGK